MSRKLRLAALVLFVLPGGVLPAAGGNGSTPKFKEHDVIVGQINECDRRLNDLERVAGGDPGVARYLSQARRLINQARSDYSRWYGAFDPLHPEPIPGQLQAIDPFGDFLFAGVPIRPANGTLVSRGFDPAGLAARAEQWSAQMKEMAAKIEAMRSGDQAALSRELDEMLQRLGGRGTRPTAAADASLGGQARAEIDSLSRGAPSSPIVQNPYLSETATVGLLREQTIARKDLADPVAWRKAITTGGLTQEDRERLYLIKQYGPTTLPDYYTYDARAFVKKEAYSDPVLDIAMAAAQGATTSVAGDLVEEGGKKVLRTYSALMTDRGFDEALNVGKNVIEKPNGAAEWFFAGVDYASTFIKDPKPVIVVKGALNAVGAGTREWVVRSWAERDSQAEYDPRPIATAKEKWNSWYDDQNKWTQAALKWVGAGEYKE